MPLHGLLRIARFACGEKSPALLATAEPRQSAQARDPNPSDVVLRMSTSNATLNLLGPLFRLRNIAVHE